MATYAAATQRVAWSNSLYAPDKLYNIIPYYNGAEVTADKVEDVTTLEEADNIFQDMINQALKGFKSYTQIEVTERIVTVPS